MTAITPMYSSLYSTLKAGTALTALVGTAAIYNKQAPDGATLPYVVFSVQASTPDNDHSMNAENMIVYVRGYASTDLAAQNISTQIDNLLHGKNLAITGYSTYWCAREQDLELVDNGPNGEKIFMAGGFYRIRCSK